MNAYEWATFGLWKGPQQMERYSESVTVDELLDAYLAAHNINISERTILSLPAAYAAIQLMVNTFVSLNVTTTALALRRVMSERFNPTLSADNGKALMTHDLKLHGNAYAQIVPSLDGVSNLELYPYHATSVTRETPDTYRVTGQNGRQFMVPAERMLHLIGLTRDGYTGISTVRTFDEHWRAAMLARWYGRSFFKNGGKPHTILTLEAGRDGLMALPNKEQLEEAKASWRAAAQSEGSRTAFLGLPLRAHSLAATPEEAQFLGTLQWDTQDTARLFGIPEVLIGYIENATLANHQEQVKMFVQNCMMPLTRQWQTELRFKLGVEVEFDFSELLRGDLEERRGWYEFLLTNNIVTREYVAEAEGLPDPPEVDNPDPANQNDGGEDDDDDGTEDEE